VGVEGRQVPQFKYWILESIIGVIFAIGI